MKFLANKVFLILFLGYTGLLNVLAGNGQDPEGSTSTIPDSEVSRVLTISEDLAYGEYLAGECASCHAAEMVSGSNVPVIHGAPAHYLARALMEYRAGIRKNVSMVDVAGALNDEEIAVLSYYMESLGVKP